VTWTLRALLPTTGLAIVGDRSIFLRFCLVVRDILNNSPVQITTVFQIKKPLQNEPDCLLLLRARGPYPFNSFLLGRERFFAIAGIQQLRVRAVLEH